MRDMVDEELMLQTQRGNVYAFELLFERYRARVFGFILRTLNGRRQEAEELMRNNLRKKSLRWLYGQASKGFSAEKKKTIAGWLKAL